MTTAIETSMNANSVPMFRGHRDREDGRGEAEQAHGAPAAAASACDQGSSDGQRYRGCGDRV
jgi:hypothetical protein